MQYLTKRVLMLSVCSLFGITGFTQTLFTYGNSNTGKDEFLRAYNKNKQNTPDKEKSMREYLELYTNFKLKVKAAQELRLDTVSQIKFDLENFRDQVAGNYMSDEKGLQILLDEAVARSYADRHVIYFSVPVAADATPADTMKAFTAAKELYARLKNSNTGYADAVTDVSAKFYHASYADAGFLTVFSVPYAYENIIYNTKPGAVSEPYRGSKGWVIFKVTEERPDPGKWKAAQILFAYPPDADYATKLKIKSKADSVYALINNGLSFDEAAKKFSEDRITYQAGGELPEFGTGKYINAFESKVFALKNDNDITAPFETPYGYHIVKRIRQTPLPAKGEASYMYEIKQKLLQDARINSEKEQFAKDITVKTGFKRAGGVNNAEIFRYADSMTKDPALKADALPFSKKTIFSYRDGTNIKGSDWLSFVKNYRANPEMAKDPNDRLWKTFTSEATMNYYKKHLEDYNADFKYQVQEFREGNMLFEIMERNVWSKAGTDSVGLMNYYAAHKENYKWSPSADAIIYNAPDEKKAAEVMAADKAGKSWEAIVESSQNTVQADSGRFELNQLPGASENLNPKENSYSTIIKNTDGTVAFVKYIVLYPGGQQRSFAEARGLVINDYQNVLEQQWVVALRKKYPVTVNEAVFKEMLK